ncbi:hypothetical protein KC19_9G173800 [Ceratodon purpureus]|uniref:Secreted protein n=1 Tax=Ceratodon purpureus TaxID=3225 RepID=A0A8T0GUZ8_CERPU|nr:hypothetical protein KC19_9G173800 [Ceratodon purpureus]
MVWVTSRFRLLMLVVCCHWISASLSAEQHCANACTSLHSQVGIPLHPTSSFHSLALALALVRTCLPPNPTAKPKRVTSVRSL